MPYPLDREERSEQLDDALEDLLERFEPTAVLLWTVTVLAIKLWQCASKPDSSACVDTNLSPFIDARLIDKV